MNADHVVSGTVVRRNATQVDRRRVLSMMVARVTVGIATLLVAAHAAAGPGEVAIWCSPAIKVVVAELASQFERETGHAAVVKSGSVEQMQGRIRAGEPPDVVMFPDETIEGLRKGGKIDTATLMAIGRVGIGMAVRKGAQTPDIATPEALRKALLQARSIAYPDPREGAGGNAVAEALKILGIDDALKARTRLGGVGQGLAGVGHGDIELALDQATEIMARPAVAFVGLLPGDLQQWAGYSAAVSSDSTNAPDAQPFLQFLAGKLARERLRAAGFEAVR